MVLIKIESINQDNEMIKIYLKIFGFNLGSSITDNSKWDKISDGIAKKIYIWNIVRLSLKGVIVNQIF